MPDHAVVTRSVRYSSGNTELAGLFAVDERQRAKRPGIAVFHDAWGLAVAQNVKMRIRMLAELGYAVLAVDMYGAEIRPQTMQECQAQVERFKADPDLIRERALAGLRVLASQPEVDPRRLGAIGYCFGGMTVLELARAGADCAGVVSFHGLLTTARPATPGSIRTKILVCHGSEDRLAPFADVQALQQEMYAAGADCQIILYTGAQHSFANPYASNNPGIAYHPVADRRSWVAMQTFFTEVLGAV
jgi:dienelactone hydrolase